MVITTLCMLMIPTEQALADPPAWPDTFVGRLQALALLQTLNGDLLSHDSATLTLDRWCDIHGLASPAHIVAERDPGLDKTPTADQRRILQVPDGETVLYRHVRLRCGSHVLSQADNWYVPARLTPEMNRQLTTSDIAFGRAVQALRFTRHTLSATLLWHPLPSGWEAGAPLPPDGDGPLDLPAALLEHRAVLTLPDGTPFSFVIETYTSEIMGFRAPAR